MKLWLPRTDWREPRDWLRPWRDRPGMFLCCCVTPNCPVCPSMPAVWNVISSGFGNDHCSNCDFWNEANQVEWVTGCIFASANQDTCGVTENRWLLRNQAGNWDLFARFGVETSAVGDTALYRLATASFDCNGTNVMPLVSVSGNCDGTVGTPCCSVPSDITIEPA